MLFGQGAVFKCSIPERATADKQQRHCPQPCSRPTLALGAERGLHTFPVGFFEREFALCQLAAGDFIELLFVLHFTASVADRLWAISSIVRCRMPRAWFTCHLLVPSLMPSIAAISAWL